MSEALQELGAYLELKRQDAVIATELAFGELNVTVQLAHLESFVEFLRDDAACRFTSLVDITAVDHPERDPRFDVVYMFLSMYQNHRVRVKVSVGEEEMVPSIVEIHPSANWVEREVFDMYEPVSLVQEYRQFDFMSPWEGAQYILPGDEKKAV
jgi:NADH-quinone oxidoreductase subunit C